MREYESQSYGNCMQIWRRVKNLVASLTFSVRLYVRTILTIAKYCGACYKKLLAEEFTKSAREGDGLDYRCKACTRARVKEIYHQNLEKSRAKSSRYQIVNHESHNHRVKKYNRTPAGRLAASFRKRFAALLGKHTDSFFHIVGCPPKVLVQYLALQLPQWASWDDYKFKFHVSLVAPSAEPVNTPEEARSRFNWNNLKINTDGDDHTKDLV